MSSKQAQKGADRTLAQPTRGNLADWVVHPVFPGFIFPRHPGFVGHQCNLRRYSAALSTGCI